MKLTIDDSFVRSYIACALWAASEDNVRDAPQDELAPETVTQMIEECEAFNTLADAWLFEAYTKLDVDYTEGQAAHDLWLTRNRHGAGFWDRGLGRTGDKLTEYAHSMGERDLYRGDDGLIYQM